MSTQLVSFPTSESASVSPLPIPHLPFRRISLPTTPSPALAAHRQSVASLASFDSLPEEQPIVHQTRRAKRRSLNPAAARSQKRTQANDDRQAKRSRIISEFYATEKSYLDGLDLVYNHFLTPILRSLDTSKPLLSRNEITTLFSNFIDIWNFHHTFFAALSRRLHPTSTSHHDTLLSPVLLAHFPYLSLYAPFITAFPAALAFLTSVSQTSTLNPVFAAFMRAQEAHPVCAHLRLADYLLTPVQRCPRYLLLLKDLLSSTDPDDPEWKRLQEARVLVEKITNSLNTSLAAHAQTLALVSLQRNTRDLPPVLTPLVAPGRRLIKRGVLLRSGSEGEGATQKPYEFLLLSDYLFWLEREELGMGVLVHEAGGQSPRKRRVSMNALDRNDEEKWCCRGHMSLVDMEVVLVTDRPSGAGSGGGYEESSERIEVLSPEGSFALHNSSSSSCLQDSNSLSSWVDSIRTARAALLAALAMSNPDSTLSASTSGVHLRRALRAFASESDDTEYVEEGRGGSASSSRGSQAVLPPIETRRSRPRRAQLDNFLPPVWIPDAKTDTCMRCGRPFGFVLDLRLGDVFGWGFGNRTTTGVEARQKLHVEADGNERPQVAKRAGGGAWRRKHHCRLCGRVVCAACSGKTFYITQDDGDSLFSIKKQKPKPSRACEECWEAAFPLILPSPGPELLSLASPATQPPSSSTPSDQSSTPQADEDPGIPPWLSIPSRQAVSKDVSEALMAMDLSPVAGALSRSPSRAALSTSPSRIALNTSPSRKSRLSTSPTKASSPLRGSYTQTQGVPGSNTSSPSRRVLHLPRISSGDSDAKQSPPSPTGMHTRDMSSGSLSPETRRDDYEYHVPTRPIRVRPSSTRPRSYHDILEDFTLHERGLSIPSSISSAPGAALGSVREGEEAEDKGDSDEDGDEEDRKGKGEDEIVIEIRPRDRSRGGHPRSLTDGNSQEGIGLPGAQQGPTDEDGVPKEDTARRRKRFSMPAVALQTAPVFARGRQDGEGSSSDSRRQSIVMYGGERDKGKKERQGEKEGSAVGLLMEVLRGRVKYPGRSS